jgi:hypothetical protein
MASSFNVPPSGPDLAMASRGNSTVAVANPGQVGVGIVTVAGGMILGAVLNEGVEENKQALEGSSSQPTQPATTATEQTTRPQVSKAISNNTIKHITNRGHLAEFQRLDPSLTLNDVIKIGHDVAETGTQEGVRQFVKTMQIGQQEVTVRAILNSNNALRSVFLVR